MDILNNIPINSTSGFIGLLLMLFGVFMILAGLDIISIQQVTVKQGRRTWILGIVFALLGFVLFYPDLTSPTLITTTPAVVDPTEVLAPTSTIDLSDTLAGWKSTSFEIPDDGLWRQKEDGTYTAVGSKDTIAWSEEIFEGDLEVSLDVQSPSAFGEANIIIYGNGRGMSPGILIFTVANDIQKIMSDTVYPGGAYLFDTMGTVDFEGQKHTILIRIVDREASLILDGEQITSVFLNNSILV